MKLRSVLFNTLLFAGLAAQSAQAATVAGLVLSYTSPTNPNATALDPGSSINFGATPIGSVGSATVVFSNASSGLGVITGITVTGAAFRSSGVPLLPYSVSPNQTLQIQIGYQPSGVTSDTGQLVVSFDGSPSVTVGLQGKGISFTYQVTQSGSTTPVSAGDTVTLAPTNLGSSSVAIVRVINNGSAYGTINAINLLGSGFSLSGVPFLPQTIAPNGSVSFVVTFTPSQAGTATAILSVNSDLVNLSGVGLGSQLKFSYGVAGTTVTLSSNNNSIFFSPIAISQTASLKLTVQNTGTLPVVLSNIGLGQGSGAYSLTGVPALPINLTPGNQFQITITFAPVIVGSNTGTLIVDSNTINLAGSGTQPPALPAYTISGVSATAAAASQPNISLALASPYPIELTGTLVLASSGTLPLDPAVQFATGGTTVNFTIPVNSTNAIFAKQGNLIGLQTGTVSRTFTLTPTFAAGGVDLTPASPTSLQFAVAPSAPVLVSVVPAISATAGTANTVSLSITGYSTTRTLKSINVQFSLASGYSMRNSSFTVDVSQPAAAWFASSSSRTFGSQFTINIPFTFAGNNQSPLSALSSATVSVTNENGSSNSVQVSLQ